MKAVSIASGSKGNCLYIKSEETAILVDMGLTCSLMEEKLRLLSIDPKSISAILVTHEHIDHCKGIGVFARKYNTKIYMHTSGYPHIIKKLGKIPEEQIICFAGSDFFIGDITVTNFEVPHDSHFCVGYSFLSQGKKVSIVTDIGKMSRSILQKLEGSDIIYIEANHDETMLLNNEKYSASLKNRILSPRGHLSNKDCGLSLAYLVRTGVKQAILAHLSEENNTPLLAYSTVKRVLKENGIIEGVHICVDVAMQNEIGTVFEVQ
jgi:phosphoribosyl 1,2-cyclic phosphodiesterase